MDVVERLRDGKLTWGDRWEAADELVNLRREIDRLRVIIWNLLDDGDETDRAAARAALKGDE
jgi:hypothetical protein